MSAARRHTTFLGRLESVLPWIGGVLLAVVLVGGGAWWLLVRRPADDANRPADPAEPAMERLLADSRAAETRYFRAAGLREPAETDVAELRRALASLQEWIDRTGRRDDETLARRAMLQRELHVLQAKAAATRSATAEEAARELLRAGQREPALARLDDALAAQREANAIPVEGAWRDLPREGRLGQELERLRAEPLVLELQEHLAAARSRLGASAWREARVEFLAARELQVRINREFPRTQHADIAALDRIDTEIESLNSADLMAELQGRETAAAARRSARDFEGAAAEFARALEVQKRINREFPRGRFASIERLDALEVARQTALSEPAAARLAEIDRAVVAALRAGRTEPVASLVADATAAADALATQFPRSGRLDAALRLKFNFLTLLGDNLPQVLDATRDAFRPVPGAAGVSLLRTEVSQRLYARVMNSNPSRNPGPDLPVESVPLTDAQEFCRRLSWVLGRTVRLPTEAEFRAALGTEPAFVVERAAAAENSAGKTRPVASPAAGDFADLLGNVAEWLAPDSTDAPTTRVAGGSYADPRETLAQVPVVATPRTERARTIGFRVAIVEP